MAATLCYVVKNGKVLLKKANRGISLGKWNGPGGKIDDGEDPEQSVRREVLEETGLKINSVFYHGIIKFFNNSRLDNPVIVHFFSTDSFVGEARSTEEGEVRWFDLNKLPISEMWNDDQYFIPLMLAKKAFDADFYFNEDNSKVKNYSIKLK